MREESRINRFSKNLVMFLLLLTVFLFFSSIVGAATWNIVGTGVVINTTYTEQVYLVDANITNLTGFIRSSTTFPDRRASLNFITESRQGLPTDTYLFQIMARDSVLNYRYANETFDFEVPSDTPPNCGDGNVDTDEGEECDDGDTESGDGCSSNCQLEVCGDNEVQSGEECDGYDLNGQDCEDLAYFSGGTLDCDSNCYYDTDGCYEPIVECGNGVIDPGEQCDGTNWGNIYDCTDFDFTSGALQCVDCEFDTDDCQGNTGGYCGDGQITVGEQCDGTNWGDEISECSDFNDFTLGDLDCSGCSFDTGDCTKPTPYCGNGIADGTDVCDEDDWGDITECEDFVAFNGGFLSCDDSCHFDTSYCTTGGGSVNNSCYDDKKNGDETDTDCGGSCLGCPNGDVCLIDDDCLSFYCKNNICSAPSCTDNIKNGLETDTDCGGNCDPCDLDSNCSINSDCASLFCNPITAKCNTPSCTDGFENGDESDVDCGGGCPNKCIANQKCRTDSDCQTGFCDYNICSYDPTLDTDGDGMPDKWEDTNGLDPNDASDADGDLDGDGHTNLDEYLDGTDPNDPYDPLPKKKRTLQIILLILGLLLMIASAGFLIYSRKVLIPQQRAAQRKAMPQRPPMQGQQARPGMQPGQRPGQRPGIRRPMVRRRPSGKTGARKSIMSKFGGGEAKKPSAQESVAAAETQKPAEKAKLGDKKPSKEFIPLSKIGKQQAKPAKKPLGEAFGKLKDLTKGTKAEGKPPGSALKELSEEYKKIEKSDTGKSTTDKSDKKKPAQETK